MVISGFIGGACFSVVSSLGILRYSILDECNDQNGEDDSCQCSVQPFFKLFGVDFEHPEGRDGHKKQRDSYGQR